MRFRSLLTCGSILSISLNIWNIFRLFFGDKSILCLSQQDPRRERGWGRQPPPPPSRNNKNKNKNIRQADLAEAYKSMIGPWSYIIRWAQENQVPHSLLVSLKTIICTKLHLVEDFCVFTSQESEEPLFIKVLKSQRSLTIS